MLRPMTRVSIFILFKMKPAWKNVMKLNYFFYYLLLADEVGPKSFGRQIVRPVNESDFLRTFRRRRRSTSDQTGYPSTTFFRRQGAKQSRKILFRFLSCTYILYSIRVCIWIKRLNFHFFCSKVAGLQIKYNHKCSLSYPNSKFFLNDGVLLVIIIVGHPGLLCRGRYIVRTSRKSWNEVSIKPYEVNFSRLSI